MLSTCKEKVVGSNSKEAYFFFFFFSISAPSSYSRCPGLSIKWTGRRLVTNMLNNIMTQFVIAFTILIFFFLFQWNHAL